MDMGFGIGMGAGAGPSSFSSAAAASTAGAISQSMPQQMMGACGGGMYEGQMMYAAGPQGGPQFAPVGCGQPFYGQPGCEQAGYYGGQPGQQQYVMPGPPVNAAPPMRLAVSTGSNAGNGNGKQRGRSERRRSNSSRDSGREQQPSQQPQALSQPLMA